MRRKRRGDYFVWDATIQAALSVGAVITAGKDELKPLIFTLPESDGTYFTYNLHPLRREIFDKATIGLARDDHLEDEDLEVLMKMKAIKPSQRYKLEPFFTLAKEEMGFLRNKTKSPPLVIGASPIPLKKGWVIENTDDTSEPLVASSVAKATASVEAERVTPLRKAPQKWTAAERKVFIETLEMHGERLS